MLAGLCSLYLEKNNSLRYNELPDTPSHIANLDPLFLRPLPSRNNISEQQNTTMFYSASILRAPNNGRILLKHSFIHLTPTTTTTLIGETR